MEQTEIMRWQKELAAAVDAIDLQIHRQSPQELHLADDTLLVAWTQYRECVVLLERDVSWGPELSTYVEPAGDGRPNARLIIDVPNSLTGRALEVAEVVRDWLASAKRD